MFNRLNRKVEDFQSEVVHIESEEELSKIISNETRLVCVEFTASWCGPCRMIAPELDRLSYTMSDKLVIAKVCL